MLQLARRHGSYLVALAPVTWSRRLRARMDVDIAHMTYLVGMALVLSD